MKILCHVDPWCKDQFAMIGKGVDPDATLVFVSGFKKFDETGLAEAYYRYVDGAEDLADWADQADSEVILRCRLLRSFQLSYAHRHVRALRRAARELLVAERPDIFICNTVDQFVHDIFFQEARQLGVATYGMIQSFVNGYFRISERGEMRIVRSPSNEEVERVRSRLAGDNYIPNFIAKAKRSPRATYFRIMFSNLARVVYFTARRFLTNERYNYHYWASARTPWQLQAHLLPKWSFGTPDWRSEIASANKPVIYIPLQHFPEATVDYWTQDPHFVDYPTRLVEIVNRLRQDFHVLIKEHPGVWGYRKPGFYRQFESLENVTICPTADPSQECINVCDAALVWTGSVGFEAALRGKPVLSVCTPYYVHGRRFMKIGLDTPATDIRAFIDRCRSIPMELPEQQDLVRYLLSGLVPGRWQNDGSYDSSLQDNVLAAREVGAVLRTVYDAEQANRPNLTA